VAPSAGSNCKRIWSGSGPPPSSRGTAVSTAAVAAFPEASEAV